MTLFRVLRILLLRRSKQFKLSVPNDLEETALVKSDNSWWFGLVVGGIGSSTRTPNRQSKPTNKMRLRETALGSSMVILAMPDFARDPHLVDEATLLQVRG